MDIIEITGLPFPAMPPSVRVLLVLAKYAALRRDPAGDPEPSTTSRRCRSSGSRSSAAPTTPTSSALARAVPATSSTSSPGPAPGTSKAYWGPEIRVGAPQPALTTNMDALTNVEQLSFNFDKEKKAMPIVFFQEPISKAPIGVPIPDVTPLNPPLGLVPPLPPKIEQSRRHGAPVAARRR